MRRFNARFSLDNFFANYLPFTNRLTNLDRRNRRNLTDNFSSLGRDFEDSFRDGGIKMNRWRRRRFRLGICGGRVSDERRGARSLRRRRLSIFIESPILARRCDGLGRVTPQLDLLQIRVYGRESRRLFPRRSDSQARRGWNTCGAERQINQEITHCITYSRASSNISRYRLRFSGAMPKISASLQ